MHLFLLATSDWNSVTLEIEPPPATATIAIEVSPGSAPAGSVAELDASPPKVVNPPAPLASEPPAVSKQDQPPAATEQQPLIVAEARVGERASLASTSATTSVEPAPVEKRAVSEPEVPTPAETAEPATQNRGDAATAVNSSEIAKPDQHISSPQQKETVGPQQSEPPGGGQQPPSIPSVAPQPNPEQASPSVPLPQRAPKAAMEKASPKPAVKEKSASKPAAKHDQPEQETSNTTSRRKPMGLASTDKPSTALTQGQPNWPGADS
ncbi:MAG TPA: hypothetical protein VJV74_06460 [Terriglobia bacterium]|nr:hypothetical protein [Terriglobia bacterium]